jgi:multimeric flavodoxin WrbA
LIAEEGFRTMKVIAISGSARKDGNTVILVQTVFAALEREGIQTELIQLAGQRVRGCAACYMCFENRDKRCVITDDITNRCIEKMLEADGILLASPTYFANVTPELMAVIDRAGMVAKANGEMFRRKVGAAVVAVRRGGANHVLNSINHFFFISQMIVPGSSYWNFGIGRDVGEVNEDEEGIRTMKVLGENFAWLLKQTSI